MQWLLDNLGLVAGLTLDHLWLSAIPIVLGFVVSVPLGVIARRFRALRGFLLGLSSALYTIPSLALFVVLPGLLGTRILDKLNVIVALTVYAVALMVRGVVDAFTSVPDEVLSSATAVGHSPTERFWRVELPLAGPVLLANLRVVSVSTVSLLSVAALIGNGGLGYLFTNGYLRDFPTEVLIGIVLLVAIAVLFDSILLVAGRLLMPWRSRAGVQG